MITTIHGDCREILPTLPANSVQCVITSPPYFNLRSYTDDPREIGKEPTPAAYVAALVDVFREVKRVLRDDGVLWLNLGDSYGRGDRVKWAGDSQRGTNAHKVVTDAGGYGNTTAILPEKNLLGIPWRVAFALQDDGWYLRSDIIWHKPNCMPESVTDRPTRAHEYLFLFAKSARYFYDADAIREPMTESTREREKYGRIRIELKGADQGVYHVSPDMKSATESIQTPANGRNRRTVWTIATQPYSGAHYATMPEALIEPCILAGSSAQACETCGAAWGRESEPTGHVNKREPAHVPGNTATKVDSTGWAPQTRPTDRFAPRCECAANTGSAGSVILDPFAGSGTVGRVAARFQRDAMLIELSEDYIKKHVDKRTDGVQIELFV